MKKLYLREIPILLGTPGTWRPWNLVGRVNAENKKSRVKRKQLNLDWAVDWSDC